MVTHAAFAKGGRQKLYVAQGGIVKPFTGVMADEK
jgi:hypothetical protein